ncbi:MAG: glutathione S-transferase N-terminal domain-containing protein [Candidatus Paceibacterota bacterium]
MLNLYYKPTCPFSKRVLAEAELLGIPLHLKDIKADEVLREELIQKGGKKQTPFLEDTDTDIKMYESGDIIEYLLAQAPDGDAKSARASMPIYKDESVCDACQ